MNLTDEINSALREIAHGWTTPNKAQILASAVVALRPEISIELGVWAGKGMISLALAHKHIGKGTVYGIDPYSAVESAKGQVSEADKNWWIKVDHNAMYNAAASNINKFGCQNVCRLLRMKSDDFQSPSNVGVLIIDGNHGDQAVNDIKRYAPKVSVGGLMFLDDLNWAGGSVIKGIQLLPSIGFKELYQITNKDECFGVFQKIK